MDTGTIDATGQVDTTAVTQGTDAAATGADTGGNTLLSGAADGGDGQAAGAAAADGATQKQDDKGATDAAAKPGDKPADGEGKDDKGDAAPAEYADFIAPDGVSFDGEVMGQFKAMAKDLNLSQDKAQKVADLGVELVKRTQAAQAQAMQAEIAKWASDSKADKEFGGDKLDENLAGAKSALQQFGSPELQQMLNESGLGNHPEVIRMLYRVNKAVSEDTVLRGQAGKPEQSMAQRLYPGMNP